MQYGGEDMVSVVVGNKSDRAGQRQVSMQEGRAWAEGRGFWFLETSARTQVGCSVLWCWCSTTTALACRRGWRRGSCSWWTVCCSGPGCGSSRAGRATVGNPGRGCCRRKRGRPSNDLAVTDVDNSYVVQLLNKHRKFK